MSADLPPLLSEPRPGRHQHHKGHENRVLGVARHSETLEPLAVYQALHSESGLWVRPAATYSETVVVNGHQTARFD